MGTGTHVSYKTYASHIEKTDPENATNTIICLINQANYLLDQQLRSLENAFLKEGGLRERMTRARLEASKEALISQISLFLIEKYHAPATFIDCLY